MDRKQKVALVLALAEKGKTYREIAKEAGVSPNTIKAILNRAGLDQTTSVSARVFELYSQQKSPLQVAIALGLKAEDAIHYHQEYFMLLGCTEFTKVYLQIKDNPWPYVNLVKLAQDLGISDEEVVDLLKIANEDLPRVRSEYDRLKEKKNSLEANIQQAEITLQEINANISKESKSLKRYRSFYNWIKEEAENLNTKKARLENALDSFQNNNETYIKIKQTVKQEIESNISNPRRLLEFALVSIFESARKHPGKLHAMYYNMPTIRTMGSSPETLIGDCHYQDSQHEQYTSEFASDYDICKNLLLDEAEQLYNRLIEESMNKYSNEVTSNTESSSPQSLQPPTELLAVQHGHATDENHHSNTDVAENDLSKINVACDSTFPQLQYKENDINITGRCIRVGKNEINLRF